MSNKVINGVTYYPAAYEGKTEAEFIEHEAHNGTPEELSKAYQKLTKHIETIKPESETKKAKK